MKINGVKVKSANCEYIVITRPDGNIVFKAEALDDLESFEKLIPDPSAGTRMLPGGTIEKDTSSRSYLSEVQRKNTLRYHYIIVHSLREATKGSNPLQPIEWESVNLNDCDTWHLWEQELKEMGLNWKEVEIVQRGCFVANALNSEKLEEARMRFLVSLAVQQNGLSSLTGEPLNTQSGGPANG